MSKEVISTNLKRFEKLDKDTYKILVSYYFTGSKAEKESLGEKAFAPVIEKMFGNEIKVIANTLVDYNAIPGNYKTCLIKAATKIIPVSSASLASVLDQNGFQTLSKNIFVDPATNAIWKKVISDSGITQLVQTQTENLEAMIEQCLDVSEVVASARPLYALNSEKFDYALFYNPSAQKVEAGIVLESNGVDSTIFSRNSRATASLSNQYLVTVAGVDTLINQFQKELKNAKGASDVLEAYINFWYNSLEGKEAANYIEKELKTTVLKAHASSLEGNTEEASIEEYMDKVRNAIDLASDDTISNIPTREEVEAILTTKFNMEKMANFAFVEDEGINKFLVKFTKPLNVDDLAYINAAMKEIFKVSPDIITTSEFVNFVLNFNK